jgi:hypothetical protein
LLIVRGQDQPPAASPRATLTPERPCAATELATIVAPLVYAQCRGERLAPMMPLRALRVTMPPSGPRRPSARLAVEQAHWRCAGQAAGGPNAGSSRMEKCVREYFRASQRAAAARAGRRWHDADRAGRVRTGLMPEVEVGMVLALAQDRQWTPDLVGTEQVRPRCASGLGTEAHPPFRRSYLLTRWAQIQAFAAPEDSRPRPSPEVGTRS